MRSKEFITESDTDLVFKLSDKYDIEPQIILFALNVKENCQPFLKECKSNNSSPFILYRGVNEYSTVVHKDVRLTDRKPLNMNVLLHQKINFYMEDHFGHPYRNAMFCTGVHEDAYYGERAYFAFPAGNYDFIYAQNQNYSDLYNSWNAWSRESEHLPRHQLVMQDDIADRFLANANYSTENIVRAAASKSEVMIWCGSYYGVQSQFPKVDILTEIMYQ